MAKHKKKHRNKKKHGRRNAAPAAAAAAPRRRTIKRAALPGWKDALAAVIGGGGSAFISGLAVNQKIVRPETGAAVLMAAGSATALLTDGTTRVVGTSMASAGAGQLTLALMQRSAVAKQPDQGQSVTPQPSTSQPTAIAPPAAAQPVEAPLKNAGFGSGYVTALFRDAVNDLADLEEDGGDSGADVYDLDDLAAA